MEPLAHISEDKTRTQTVAEHLANTSELAGRFAAAFGAENEARFAGKLHDIGKFSRKFQGRLQGGPPVDHSTAGAQEAMKAGNIPAAFAIAGHHTGIPDGGHPKNDTPDDATLFGRLKKTVEPYDGWQEVLPLPQSAPPAWAGKDNLSLAFFTRMLYSCLVDADFIDTETFMNGQAAPRGNGTGLSVLLERVRAKANTYLSSENVTAVGQQRNAVLQACLDKGAHGPQGLYTLTVPTGGGKTFASLAFALEHAVAQCMKRVIYVIPYMSIIDQTAEVFADLMGKENVLADYSCASYKSLEQEDLTPEQYRQLLASENWDAPIVVTTAVQFFESLYANRSSRCRKLHNIADSVLIFDEAQTIPLNYLNPCVSAIAQLVQHYHVTAVLCTATQPALEPFFRQFAPELHLQEISPNPTHLYDVLRRTTLCDLGTLSQEALTARLAELPQVLCVVNRRKTAQELFAALPEEGSYCLTTLLCPADRRVQLAEIRQRLHAGLPCRVVSTSLIEAGVDVDFPLAYREQCGLDSLLQTAGRCNREGKNPAAESLVCRFQLKDCPVPSMLSQAQSVLDETAAHFPQLDTPAAIHNYFQQLYAPRGAGSFDTSGILDAICHGVSGCKLPFAWVAENFHLIKNVTRTVYLSLEDGKDLCDQLRSGHASRSLYRRLGAYSVACYQEQFDALNNIGALEVLPNGSAILTDPNLYSRKTGLALDVETGIGLFF